MDSHWPGHGRTQTTDKSREKGKHKECPSDSNLWQWPHLEYGSIGSATLVSKGGRVRWSTLVDTCHSTRWLPMPGKPVKVFPETRSPVVNINEHSSRQRAEKGLQYLRAYFPDADFPGELVGNALEADTRDMRRLEAFDPLLGNLLEIMSSHQFQNEYTVTFPMGELGQELNISRLSSDKSGNMVFIPTRSPSFVFETPILQISSTVQPPQWISAPSSALLVRTHTSSSLLRVESSKVTQELDITRSETGDIPISDSRILASGDIVVVNRSGEVYKCNTYHGGKAMQLVRGHEVCDDDSFWQLSVTGRNDECFLASCKAVKHIDLRSANSAADVFSLEHPSIVVTSFESPVDNYIGRITTTSDIIWLDDRFRKRPLLSYKHYRSFDRTLRVTTANCGGASLSLLTSRRNGLVSLYDVSRGTDGLLHCNSNPFCLPQAEPVFMAYNGDALVAFPSNERLMFLRLCPRGSIYRQDIGVARSLDEDQPGSLQHNHVTHRWDEDILTLEKCANELQSDFGPAGGRHFSEVNFRGAYEKIFAIGSDAQEDVDDNTFKDVLAQLPDIWQNNENFAENMLTTSDIVSNLEDVDKRPRSNIDPKDVVDALMHGYPATQKLSSLAQWHYNIKDTSIPALNHCLVDCASLHGYLGDPDLVSEVERHDTAVQQETDARKQLVLDLSLSTDVFSTRPLPGLQPFSAVGGISSTDISYGEEPPEVKFGYFRPVRKIGGDHYVGEEQDKGGDPVISSPLGVRLLLAEWELGTDPKDYAYRDPYGVGDIDALPIPEYRKLPAPQMTQKRQVAPQRPPLVVAAATQPLVVQTVARPVVTGQREMIRQAESQQSVGFLEEPMASTQVLPGRFGGRQKAGKKRIGGF